MAETPPPGAVGGVVGPSPHASPMVLTETDSFAVTQVNFVLDTARRVVTESFNIPGTLEPSAVASPFESVTASPSAAALQRGPSPGAAQDEVALERELAKMTRGMDRATLQRLCIAYAKETFRARCQLQELESAADPFSAPTAPLVPPDTGDMAPRQRRLTLAVTPPNDEPLANPTAGTPGNASQQSAESLGNRRRMSKTQGPPPAAPLEEAPMMMPAVTVLDDSLESMSDDSDAALTKVEIEAELDGDVQPGDRSLTPQQASMLLETLENRKLSSSAVAGARDSSESPSQFNLNRSALVQHDEDGGMEQVNEYMFFDKLGSGAMGVVWHAVDEAKGFERAIKVIPRDKLSQASPMAGETSAPSLIDEVDFMKDIRHRHIVQLHELIDDPGRTEIFLVMDFIKGGAIASLDTTKGTCPRLHPNDVAIVAWQIGSALYHCHRLGFTHGDVKPDNILCDKSLDYILEAIACAEGDADRMDSSVMNHSIADSPRLGPASPSASGTAPALVASLDPLTPNVGNANLGASIGPGSPVAKFRSYLADFGVAAALDGDRQCRRADSMLLPSHREAALTQSTVDSRPPLHRSADSRALMTMSRSHDPDGEIDVVSSNSVSPAARVGNPARWTPRQASRSPQHGTPEHSASAAVLSVDHPRPTRAHSSEQMRPEPPNVPRQAGSPPATLRPAFPAPTQGEGAISLPTSASNRRSPSHVGRMRRLAEGQDAPPLAAFGTDGGPLTAFGTPSEQTMSAESPGHAARPANMSFGALLGPPVAFRDESEDDEEEELRKRAAIGKRIAKVQDTTPVLEAPERLEGAGRSSATDMWALGVTLYALLFGRVPFFAETYSELREKVLRTEPEWPPETASGVYARWKRILQELLRKNPRIRMSALELRGRKLVRAASGPDAAGMSTSSPLFGPARSGSLSGNAPGTALPGPLLV